MFRRSEHLSEPDCQDRFGVAVDETKLEVNGTEVYVWVPVDCKIREVLYVDVTSSRSSLDALLFLREVLQRCYNRPLLRADCGPWYDWSLELLDCDSERETGGINRLSKPI